MPFKRRITTGVFGLTCLLLPAYGPTLADQVSAPTFSAGSAISSGDSMMILGQSAIGLARSTTHRMHAGGLPAMIHLATSRLLGDLDGDGDVDVDDHALFVACMQGPEVSFPTRRCPQELFDLADIEADHDVDMADFRYLNSAYTN